jgi:uncharacterized protein YdaU (DUF1376 family)
MPQPTNKRHQNSGTRSSYLYSRSRRAYRRSIAGIARLPLLLILLGWFIVLAVVFADRQNLLDWWRLHSYQAPTQVAQIATSDTMTSYARKIWYVNHPALDDKPTFREACPDNGGEQTIVLGCYHSNQAGIFLLKVSDARLQGVEEVTAAHEMLHAAYDRLSASERQAVDAQLTAFYEHDLHDDRIKATIATYKQSEPRDVVNEMHSIFGTEVSQLPPSLEQHYQRYFKNRAQVVTFSSQYQAEFTSRQQMVAQADAQLASLKKQIDSREADLKAKQASIGAQHDQLLQLRNSGNVTAYNAGVPAYNGAIDAYNQEVAAARALINQYNQLVARRNAIALEQDELVNSLKSNTPTLQ